MFRRTVAVVIAAAFLVGVVLFARWAWEAGQNPYSYEFTSPSSSAPTHQPPYRAVPPSANGLKPVLEGLVVRRSYPGLSAVVGQLGGLVLALPWSVVQPTQGGPIIGGQID